MARTKKTSLNGVRHLLVAISLGYYSRKWFKPILLPHGRAVKVAKEDRPVFDAIDFENDSLQGKHGRLSKIYERVPEGADPILKGPETIFFDNVGTMYTLTEEGKVVSLTDFEEKKVDSKGVKITTAKTTEVLDLGIGRPLGGKFAKDGTLYVADSVLGLIRVKDFQSTMSTVELVATRVKVDGGDWSRILYANDVAIGPKTGMVYFSDASDIAPDRIKYRSWDTLYASKIDYSRGKPTGRLLRYDPNTNEVVVLANGIHFANGIAVDKDETYAVISETFQGRALKYHITGDKEGTTEVLADKFPGYTDGADCSWYSGLCYAAVPSSVNMIMNGVHKLPHPIDMILRTFLMTIPRKVAPAVVPYGGFVEILPGDESSPGKVIRILQDPTGEDIGMITAVTVHDNKIFCGSLENNFVGVYDLA